MNYPVEFRIKSLELLADFTLGAVHIEVVQTLLLSYVEFDIGPSLVNFLAYNFSDYEFKEHELDDLFKDIGLLRLSEQAARDIRARQIALDMLKNQDSAAGIANDTFYSYHDRKEWGEELDSLDEIRHASLDWEDVVIATGENYEVARQNANQEAVDAAKEVIQKVKIEKYLI